MTNDGSPCVKDKLDKYVCVYMYSASFDTKRACMSILSLPASLRDNERRYIDHRPEHSAETKESGLFRVNSEVADLELPTCFQGPKG